MPMYLIQIMNKPCIQKMIALLIGLLLTEILAAQPKERFDPERFQADLEQFITIEAVLTAQEAAIFFPVYREMKQKQHAIFGQMKRYRFTDVTDDKASHKAIEEKDKLDIQIKELQQKYHDKFMKLLPAGKVLKIIKAEDKFHRQAFRRMAKRKPH